MPQNDAFRIEGGRERKIFGEDVLEQKKYNETKDKKPPGSIRGGTACSRWQQEGKGEKKKRGGGPAKRFDEVREEKHPCRLQNEIKRDEVWNLK